MKLTRTKVTLTSGQVLRELFPESPCFGQAWRIPAPSQPPLSGLCKPKPLVYYQFEHRAGEWRFTGFA